MTKIERFRIVYIYETAAYLDIEAETYAQALRIADEMDPEEAERESTYSFALEPVSIHYFNKETGEVIDVMRGWLGEKHSE